MCDICDHAATEASLAFSESGANMEMDVDSEQWMADEELALIKRDFRYFVDKVGVKPCNYAITALNA